MTGRGLRGRRQARLLLLIACLTLGFEVFLFAAQPTYMDPMFAAQPSPSDLLLPAAAMVQLLALGWMVRIYRADPEAPGSSWRAHPSWWRFDRF